MRHIPNANHTGVLLHLRMAFEAEVIVAFGQQLRIDRAMDIVTGDTTFAQRFVLEDVRFGLLPVALGALRVDAPDERPLGRVNFGTMRIMTGSATHPAFQHRVVILQAEFRLFFQMAPETGFGLFLRVHDELTAAATGIHVQTARTMTGFAATR